MIDANGQLTDLRPRLRTPQAATLLFRLLTYGLEIPLGAVTYLIWQRKRSWRKPLHRTAPAAVPVPLA
jgi:hypothetical protein